MSIAETLPRSHNEPPLEELLAENAASLIARRDELLASAARAPEAITDDEMSGKVADLVRLISACVKASEAARVAAKEPYLAAGRLVDAVYKKISDPLDGAKRLIEQRLTIYQRAKAEEERRRREAEARRQAEEAERQRKAAAEAAAKIVTETDLDNAVSADELARQAAADAVAAQRAADAKAADMSRTRGDYGAVASLRTFWDFTDLDREKVNLETLRPYLSTMDIEKALRGFIRAGGRELRGVRIFENTSTTVR